MLKKIHTFRFNKPYVLKLASYAEKVTLAPFLLFGLKPDSARIQTVWFLFWIVFIGNIPLPKLEDRDTFLQDES